MKHKERRSKAVQTDIDLSFLNQEINTDLLEQLYEIVVTHPDQVAIRWREEELTYSRLMRRIEQTARQLQEQGLNENSRLLLFYPNSIDYVILLLAGLTTGAVMIPVDFKLAPELLEKLINEAAPDFVIHPLHLTDRIRKENHHFARDVRFLTTDRNVDQQSQVTAINSEEPDGELPRSVQHAESRVVYFYRNQRGRMIGAEFHLTKLVTQAHKVRRRFSILKPDHLLCQMSLAHFVILSNMLFPSLLSAATLLLLDREEDDDRVDEVIERYTPHLMINTRKYFYILLKNLRESGRQRKVQNCIMIADGNPLDWVEEFEEEFSTHLLPGLASPLIAGFVTLTLPFLCREENAVGTPMIGVEYHIINRDGEILPAGEWGELVINSPYVLDGFYNNTDLQFEKAVEDFYRTHQMACQGAHGYLFLADEVQDVIRLKGFKISPLEIEEELVRLPGVEDAVAVNGVSPSQDSIVTFVKLEEGSQLAGEDVMEEASRHLPGYLLPQKVILVDDIPYSNEDRKLRAELKNRMEDQITGGTSESV